MERPLANMTLFFHNTNLIPVKHINFSTTPEKEDEKLVEHLPYIIFHTVSAIPSIKIQISEKYFDESLQLHCCAKSVELTTVFKFREKSNLRFWKMLIVSGKPKRVILKLLVALIFSSAKKQIKILKRCTLGGGADAGEALFMGLAGGSLRGGGSGAFRLGSNSELFLSDPELPSVQKWNSRNHMN